METKLAEKRYEPLDHGRVEKRIGVIIGYWSTSKHGLLRNTEYD